MRPDVCSTRCGILTFYVLTTVMLEILAAIHYSKYYITDTKLEVRMQSKNTISIVHVTASMCSMHKLYVGYLERTLDAH